MGSNPADISWAAVCPILSLPWTHPIDLVCAGNGSHHEVGRRTDEASRHRRNSTWRSPQLAILLPSSSSSNRVAYREEGNGQYLTIGKQLLGPSLRDERDRALRIDELLFVNNA